MNAEPGSPLPVPPEGRPSPSPGPVRDLERQAADSWAMLRGLLDATSDGLLIQDPEGAVAAYNAQFVEIFRFSPKALEARDAAALRAHARARLREPDKVEQEVRRLAGDPDRGGVVLIEFADGRWYEAHTLPRRKEGRPAGRVWSLRDVTRQKTVEEALRRSEKRFRDIIEHGSNLFYTHTPDHVLTYLSPQTRQFLDCEPDEALRRWTEFVTDHPANLRGFQSTQKAIQTGERQPVYELELAGKKGRRIWVEVHEAPVVEGGRTTAIVGALVDITERKKIEAELVRSNTELERFAYVASHDLQEPLRMVCSYLQLIERRLKDHLDPDVRDFVRFAVDGGHRMQELIQGLLTYSRVGSATGRMEPVDFGEALRTALLNLGEAVRESGAVVTHDPLPTAPAIASQIAQVFQNLIGNAIKFHGDQPPRIHVGAEGSGESWAITVSDNGIGMDPSEADTSFQMFRRLHGMRYPGSGIGLAVCKKIVERHGGRIGVESRPGGGSRFRFTIPRKETGP